AAGSHLAGFDGELLPLVASLGVVAVVDDLAAVLEVVLVRDLVLVALVVDVPDVEEHPLPVRILGEREHRVRGLALIVPGEPAAERHDAHRMRLVLVDRPLRDVELVRALVVEVAVAGLPEPVPVVVDEVVVVLLDLRRATPEIPVEMRRGILRVLHADSAARLAAVSVGDLQLSELPGVDRIVKTLAARVAPALRAVLDHG